MSTLTAARWVLATPLIIFGCFLFMACPLIGSGVHLDPSPGLGMFFAGSGLAIAIGGYWLIRSELKTNILATVINIVLIIGSASLIYGLIGWGFEKLYQVQSSEEGHLRPGELLFRISYGMLSVAGLGMFNRVIRKSSVSATQ
jgi:hypothetical protein